MPVDRAIADASLLEVNSSQRLAQPGQRLILLALLALLMFGPLAFGAVEPWAIVIQELGAAALATFWLTSARQKEFAAIDHRLVWPWAVLAGIVILQLLLRTTVYLHATIAAGLQATTYFLIFLVAASVLAEAANAKTFARTLAIFGALLAFWSVLQGFASPTKLYGLRTTHAGGTVYGPYVNHSHYAGLMEMLAPFALVLAFRKDLSRQERIQWGLAGLLMAGSIFLSESRGGMVAFAAEFVFLAIILIRQRGQDRTAAILVAAASFLAIFIFWLGAGELEARLATFRHPGVSVHTRFQIAKDTLHMWRSHPWLGFGLGTFTRAYPQFRSFYSDELVNAAHNDYLQFLSELGVLGFGAILWFLIAAFRRGLSSISGWSASSSHSARLAALLGIVGIAVHSLTDFNLQIPANAALFFALCALASSAEAGVPRKRANLPALPAYIVLALYAFFCLQIFAGAQLSQSSSAGRLRLATRFDPLNSGAWMKLGHMEYFLDQQPALAAQDLRRSVALDPLQARAWLELASVEQSLGNHDLQITALGRAYTSDPTTPIYLLAEASSYFSAGEPSLAFRRLRDVSAHHSDSLAPALQLAWRATHDADLILREVAAGDPSAQMALLRFLSALGEEPAAGRVWSAVQPGGHPFDPVLAVPYVQLLLNNNRADEALAAWQALTAKPGMADYQISQNLLANAGFEADILNNGLDWHYQPMPGVSVNVSTEDPHGGRRALCLSFDGAVSATGLSHYLALPSRSTFLLNGFYRAPDLRGAGGLAWSLRDLTGAADVPLRDHQPLAGSSQWQPFQGEFSTGPQKSVLLLSLKRVPAGDILRGDLCLDDLSITKK